MSKKPTIIANGAHGCLVSPSLRCKIGSLVKDFENTSISDGDNVSKIFIEKASWTNELKVGLKITQIPDYHKYFIVPLQACEVDENEGDIWDSCEILTDKKKPKGEENNFYQLVMKNGGVNLREYLTNIKTLDIVEWLEILLKVLNCLNVLAKHRLVHMDAKLENIVYDPTTKIVRLIDFGLTDKFENMYKPVYKTLYMYWPIEFKIYEHCVDNQNMCDTASIQSEFIDMLKEKNILTVFRIHKVEENIENLGKENFTSDENLAKIDIYSLGVSCMIMARSLKGKDNLINNYIKLLRNMCNFKCKDRISVDGAITEIEGLLKKSRTRQSNITKTRESKRLKK